MQSTAEDILRNRTEQQVVEDGAVEQETLGALVDEISLDAAALPDLYLRHTVVPEGGE